MKYNSQTSTRKTYNDSAYEVEYKSQGNHSGLVLLVGLVAVVVVVLLIASLI